MRKIMFISQGEQTDKMGAKNPNSATDGTFTEGKEVLGGFIIINTKDMDCIRKGLS